MWFASSTPDTRLKMSYLTDFGTRIVSKSRGENECSSSESLKRTCASTKKERRSNSIFAAKFIKISN